MLHNYLGANGMTRILQSQTELERHFDEQLNFIDSSARAFDKGELSEAKRLACHIRTLVHDTNKSRSLMGQLNLKNIAFIDGGDVPNPRNLIATHGLTGIHHSQGASRWVPKFEIPSRPLPKLASFDTWWKRPVLVDDQRVEFSRKDLVLALANQDGGAHVDPELDLTYARLSRQNSIGWFNLGPDSKGPIEGVELASVRQIAWELMLSIKQKRIPAPIKLTDIGRNESCFCGSGVKLKKCACRHP